MTDHPPGDHSRPPERFPCSSRTVGVVALAALAVAVVLVILDGGVSLANLAVVAALVLVALGVWLTMVRPTIHAHEDHVLVRNALTDTAVPWHLVEAVEVRQVLVIRTETQTVHGIAVGRSARQQLRNRGQRTGPSSISGGLAAPEAPRMSTDADGADRRTTGHEPRGDYADMVAQRLDNLAAMNRRTSMRLDALDKQWRWAEVLAVLGVVVAFALLVVLAAA